MKLNCIIVDDEPMARKVLEEYIADTDFLHLAAKAENPMKAMVALEAGNLDLMLLDINMPRMSGIEFLRQQGNLPMTIVTTAYSEYALEGFELDVVDYLVKPFSYARFLKAATKAKEYQELKKKPVEKLPLLTVNYFFVKCNGKIEKVYYDELLYIEAMLNYVILQMETRKLMVYLTIKSVAEQLPADIFLKVHKSTIVNISKIKSIEGNLLDMGKAKVVISQNLHDEVIEEIVKDRILKR